MLFTSLKKQQQTYWIQKNIFLKILKLIVNFYDIPHQEQHFNNKYIIVSNIRKSVIITSPNPLPRGTENYGLAYVLTLT